MIYTVTLNPSIDYIVSVEDLKIGEVNRTTEENFFPGGKGINVSIVLHNLGVESTALGFVAGFTGQQIEEQLSKMQIKTDFIHVENGVSRVNIKLKARQKSENETEINGIGPKVSEQELASLFAKLCKLNKDDILVLAGSVPASLPKDIYQRICEDCDPGVKIVVDTTKELLWNVLACHPYLIKPNHHELGELFGVMLQTKEEIFDYAEKLQKQGARAVMVSMAEKGAVFLAEDGSRYEVEAPNGKVINAVGAGDSMVAGFLAAMQNNKLCKRRLGAADQNIEKAAFEYGVVTGSASAFSSRLTTLDEVEALLAEL